MENKKKWNRMHNPIFDRIEPAEELVANGFVAGGDFSGQAVGINKIACNAAVRSKTRCFLCSILL